MASRLSLQTKLEEILGSGNVYYQPPESKKIEYPAIVYALAGIDKKAANDTAYSLTNKYELILIASKSNIDNIASLLALPMSSYDRQYKADNLYHDVLTLYY